MLLTLKASFGSSHACLFRIWAYHNFCSYELTLVISFVKSVTCKPETVSLILCICIFPPLEQLSESSVNFMLTF